MADSPPEIKLDHTDKPNADLAARKAREEKVNRSLAKLQALQERLYHLRYDSAPDVQKLRNLAAEINRVHAKILDELYASTDAFEGQLELHALGLDHLFRDRNPETKGFIRTPSADGGFIRTASSKGTFVSAPSSKGGFMRTPSTKGAIAEKSPQQAWQSLLKMFQEWAFQNNVADAQYIASRPAELSQLDSDIAKLRAAIRAMNGRKRLNEKDQKLLEDLKDQLKLRLKQKERISREEFHIGHESEEKSGEV